MNSRVFGIMVVVAALSLACVQGPSVVQRNADARRMTAELQTNFAVAVDAAHRAVMADSDEAATLLASDAGKARARVKQTADELAPPLRALEYTEELTLLEEFGAKFTAYEVLDRQILELAVDNTNLKATRVSYGPSKDAADAFAAALRSLVGTAARDAWQLRSLAAEAEVGVRTTQALQAPHIAEASDAVMSRLEREMKEASSSSRRALAELAALSSPADTAAASLALDKFIALNDDVIALSRRNTRVRSLALTMGQKRILVATCEASLRALSDALAKRISRPSR